MRKKRLKGAAEAITEVGRDPTRGEVFWFLYDEHDAIRGHTRGKRISWRTMLQKVQALGLTNADGKPVSKEKALKLTFARVCALKRLEADARQKRSAERKPPVTNSPPPEVKPAPAVRSWSYERSNTAAVPSSTGGGESDDPLIRQFRKRSGWRD